MKKNEIIEGLKELKIDKESFFTDDGTDEIFRQDVDIIQGAIDLLQEYGGDE